MIDFKIPMLGENIESGDVVKVSVQVGDVIAVDQTVLELETDKAVVEVPSSVAGKVAEVLVSVGDKAAVGQTVFKIESSGAVSAPQAKAVKEEPKKPKKIEAKKKEPAAKVVEAPVETVEIPQEEPVAGDLNKTAQPASPSVRRLSREIGVDLDLVQGTGPGGRISLEDVKTYARSLSAKKAKSEKAKAGKNQLPDFTKWGEVKRKPMNAIRRKTAQHLSDAWYIPHVTQSDKTDITDLEKLRKSFADRAAKQGGKLTMTVIILKVVASALKVFPQFNASVDMETDEVIYKKYYNIGVATDTDRGLLVPVLRDVENKNILELSAELSGLAQKARDKKLSLEDMQGGTFTITNLGGIGGTHFTPIINAPEVAILGVSRGRIEPVYINGEFKPRLMLPLSLSYDHRLIDGADAMRFLRWIAEALQQPFLMDLEG
jgi:pyruvate dehydrogenase E2 component (dihydrolipoamide acetyltransferase)